MNFQTKRKLIKGFALTMSGIMLWNMFAPHVAKALTSGPSQPEVQSFQPIGTSDMVDLFTGDFHYNIPLLDVGGYPVNLAYNSGISADQEASWVGLGWNLNVGAITRNMRGIPDEFKGDMIQSEYSVKDHERYGLDLGAAIEIFGKNTKVAAAGGPSSAAGDSIDPSNQFLTPRIGIYKDNYTGMGLEVGTGVSLGIKVSEKTSLNLDAGLNVNSQEGTDVSADASLALNSDENKDWVHSISTGIGTSINARSGLKGFNLFAGYSISGGDKNAGIRLGTNNILGLGNAFLQLADPTYVPYIEHPMKGKSISMDFKLGIEGKGSHGSVNARGYYSENTVAKKTLSKPAYGYMYGEAGVSKDNAVFDFNREKDGPYTRNTPHIAIPNPTYDTYSVTGQGIGGVFRVHRGDVGMVRDPRTSGTSDGHSISAEAGIGDVVKVGGNYQNDKNQTYSGKWKTENAARNNLKWQAEGARDYEPFHFQMEGEKNTLDAAYAGTVAGTKPVRIGLSDAGVYHTQAENRLESPEGPGFVSTTMGGPVQRAERETRNYLIQALDGIEASHAGTTKKIENFDLNGNGLIKTDIDRNFKGRMPVHHPSEFRITSPDGSRNVYGIPVLNVNQTDVSFAMGFGEANPENISSFPDYQCNTGVFTYSGTMNSRSNEAGVDNFFNKEVIPTYAYSYLLTAVLSTDYEDLSQNGPTPDDPGTYVKFNYGKTTGNYHWRMPIGANKAKHDQGLLHDASDDRGSYSFGEKEIWYLKTIETRDYIAVFEMTDRQDGKGVAENGSLTSDSQKKLNAIRLYARHEYMQDPATAVPIKTVHFTYDYSLCPGVPNFSGSAAAGNGKLTLKAVYFTYYNSHKGATNSYEFTYANNQSYGLTTFDRWGTYMPETGCNDEMNNSQFPYAVQNKTDADLNASAWNLEEIKLPSGGVIHVDYESDDYGYVQDRPAMQMFSVAGVHSQKDMPVANLHQSSLYDDANDTERNFVYFTLEEPIPATANVQQILHDKYIGGMEYLYFRFLVNIGKPDYADPSKDHYEYVPGYAKVKGYGVSPTTVAGKYTTGWVELVQEPIGDRDNSGRKVNPVSRAAWQFARMRQPHLVYPGYSPDPSADLGDAIKGLAVVFNDIKALFTSQHKIMRDKNMGWQYKPEASRIRLYSADGRKYGGGHRVKKITISDEWDQMNPPTAPPSFPPVEDFTYGQEYSYEMEVETKDYDQNSQKDVEVVSSGVAQYEPLFGGDENPFREPIIYNHVNLLALDDRYVMEMPLCESMFPTPSVGYSKVTVKNLSRPGVQKHATGSVVNEFYTAQDYPTIVKSSGINPVRTRKSKPILKLLKISSKDYKTVSEGFTIVRNDMHGKPKAVWVYAEPSATPTAGGFKPTGSRVSGTQYFYKSGVLDGKNVLENKVEVVFPDNTIEEREVGVSICFLTDERESQNLSTQSKMGGQIDFSSPVVIVPTMWPSMVTDDVRFRSVAATKIIDRYGILERVVAWDRNASIPTKNVLWDAVTGEPLLTVTQNEFQQSIYSLALPAHWAYEGMEPAYQNAGLSMACTHPAEGRFQMPAGVNPADYFHPGDEILVTYPAAVLPAPPEGPFWVHEISGSSIHVIDKFGEYNADPVTDPDKMYPRVKILRSGHRNMHTAGIASLTSMVDPVDRTPLTPKLNFALLENEALAAGAVEFSENWQIACFRLLDNPGYCGVEPGKTINPYLEGVRGHWRGKTTFAFLDDRTRIATGTNVREDGKFDEWYPFWNYAGSAWAAPGKTDSRAQWQRAGEATLYHNRGLGVEDKDPLDNSSTVILGYDHSLVTATAKNSRHRDVAFENFEDYDLLTGDECTPLHWSWYAHKDHIVESEAHTGLRSLFLDGGSRSVTTIPYDCSGGGTPADPYEYDIACEDCLPMFLPSGPRKYVFTAWVKEIKTTSGPDRPYSYRNSGITLGASLGPGAPSPITSSIEKATGEIIDGWQRIEFEFTMPAGVDRLHVTLNNTDPANYDVYFDDLRISPYDALMTSYVYHPVNRRLMAQLDENHYATFFEYDEDGSLIRTKKETERGVLTVQENRTNLAKGN